MGTDYASRSISRKIVSGRKELDQAWEKYAESIVERPYLEFKPRNSAMHPVRLAKKVHIY